MAYRHRLWSLGFGIAEAMDTAQRGSGLDWPTAKLLIARSATEARSVGARIAAGAGTDQLVGGDVALRDVRLAYEEQVGYVESTGCQVVLMASRALARAARTPEDYLEVYAPLLAQVASPVILHWLGDMFDPSLTGYWGSTNLDSAADTVLELIEQFPSKVDGIKVSLLDAEREISLRRRLPAGVRLYTGDDYHYPELIGGDALGYSDALLGVFDAIAAPAAAAFAALDRGDHAGYHATLDPTVPLALALFATPTYHYKTGLTFLAWLNEFQQDFVMIGGLESARSYDHLRSLLTLAESAGVLIDPERAAARFSRLLP